MANLPADALEFFRKQGQKGGKARAEKLTAKKRSEIAKKAAAKSAKVRSKKAAAKKTTK
jgi:hypothetical protein